jgi:hypothetical protein
MIKHETLQAIHAEVNRETSFRQSVVALLTSLHDRVTAALDNDDEDEARTILAEAKANGDAFADAIASNTGASVSSDTSKIDLPA